MPNSSGIACAGLAADVPGAVSRASTAGRPTATAMALRHRAAAAALAMQAGPPPPTRTWRTTSSATPRAPRPLSAVRPHRPLGLHLLGRQCCFCHLAARAVEHCCLPEIGTKAYAGRPCCRTRGHLIVLHAHPTGSALHGEGAAAPHGSAPGCIPDNAPPGCNAQQSVCCAL